MDTGIAMFPTHEAVDPATLARMAEERGHGAVYFPEHTHIPASRESPWSGGAELPRRYSHTYDLFVAMTAAATATSRVRIGSGICLVTERDPIITAKEAASVDASRAGASTSGWARDGTARSCATTARTRPGGWPCCATGSRR